MSPNLIETINGLERCKQFNNLTLQFSMRKSCIICRCIISSVDTGRYQTGLFHGLYVSPRMRAGTTNICDRCKFKNHTMVTTEASW